MIAKKKPTGKSGKVVEMYTAATGYVQEPEYPVITRNESGWAENRLENVVSAIKTSILRDPAGFQLYFDEFKGTIQYKNSTDVFAVPEQFTDARYAQLRLFLEREYGFMSITDRDLKAAVVTVAHENAIDSAIDWIKSLKWDGVPRVDGFLSKYFGTPNDRYHIGVARYIWTGLAARCSTPGHKADAIPVLVGTQGQRKTTAIECLAPTWIFPDSFGPVKYHSSPADRTRAMRGTLVQEFGELAGLAKNELTDFKEFASTSTEVFVDKFDKFASRYKRRSLIIGSSNEDDFINDPTGSRRWLPFYVENEIDTEALKKDVENLWAEGYAMFKDLGDVDWSVTLISEEHNRQFSPEDTLKVRLANYLLRRDNAVSFSFTALRNESIGHAFMDVYRTPDMAAKKFKAAMLALGFERQRDMRAQGGGQRDFVWCDKALKRCEEYRETDYKESPVVSF